jgi:hypothetical protein
MRRANFKKWQPDSALGASLGTLILIKAIHQARNIK